MNMFLIILGFTPSSESLINAKMRKIAELRYEAEHGANDSVLFEIEHLFDEIRQLKAESK